MPFHLPARTAREKMFWASVVALAVGQLAAIWVLCSHQVRQAQAREATMQVERTALADCLRYIPGSTPHRCSARLATAHDPDAVRAAGENTAGLSAAARLGRAAHVNFTLR
jgi:uncharacterized protein (DUF1684 family)